MYVVFRYTGMLRQPLERLTRYMNGFLMAAGGIERVGQLLSTRPSIVDGPGAPLPRGPVAVDVSNVSFAYDTEPVLREVSFPLDAGEVLGVLGRTGSGKTTLGRLLFRLQDPLEGSVRLAGADIRTLEVEPLRSCIGLVTQDVQLFHASLRDNVALFDRSISDDRLLEAFDELGLADWVRQHQEGLNTMLGGGGRGLSGGEAQL